MHFKTNELTPETYQMDVLIPIENDGNRAGTLYFPKDKSTYGLLLILPGSGNLDRFGNAGIVHMKIYAKIQESISSMGTHAVFLYDKRGVGASSGDFYTTGLHTT
jgi:hypothetical protein